MSLLDIVVCPECKAALALERGSTTNGDHVEDGTLACAAGHRFPIAGKVARFVQHELGADQARTRDSFGYEWTRLYPEHGHSTQEAEAERDIFLEYTRTVPSDFKGRLILDAGCGNGRYAKLANAWGARVVGVDISAAVDIASRNVADRPGIDVIQADLFRLPFHPKTFDAAYSVGVLHHTPDARGAFKSITQTVKPGGWFGIFVHARGNRALHFTNRALRAWTAKASYRATWNFALVLTAIGKALQKLPLVGPMLYVMGRQVIFFSPDQHNNFDHFSAGFTSFHRKEEVRQWYGDWDDVAVRYAGVANESIYARGTRPSG